MKTTSIFALRLSWPLRQTNKLGLIPTVPGGVRSVGAAIALLSTCWLACGAEKATSRAQPMAADLRFQLGTVALMPDTRPADFSFEKAKGQIGYASDWAGAAVAEQLGTSTSEPILDLVLGVGNLIAALPVAGKAAIDARKRMAPEKLTECETNLVKAMSEMAVQQRFHDWLSKAASEQCRGRLVPWEEPRSTGSGRVEPESVLEARVDELRLERLGSGDTSYRLRITTRARLVRRADGVLLCDVPDEYRSGTCLFSDWTLHNAFQSVAETGYRLLAERCVSRLLSTTDSPVLLGAGQSKAAAANRNAGRLIQSQPASPRPPVYRVSYAAADTGALGIYSTGSVTHVVIPHVPDRDEATSEALDDVKETFGDLIEHPNPLVSACGIITVIPVSIFKQGSVAVRGLSPRTLREADAKLSAAAKETRPHEQLAGLVAQQLAPQIAQEVILVRQPLPPGGEEDAGIKQLAARGTLAALTGGQTASGCLLNQGVGTAVEVHVENASLSGKDGINPKLALCVEARVTLLRSQDGQQLYSCPVHYRSKGRHLKEWAAHDSRLFREELRRCYRDLSASMVEQLVTCGVLLPDHRSAPTFAQQ